MLLHARIAPVQIDGLIMRPSRPSFCVCLYNHFEKFNENDKIYFGSKTPTLIGLYILSSPS